MNLAPCLREDPAGIQEVCAFYESPGCPQGVWACEVLGGVSECIDPELTDPNMGRHGRMDPVCGCDGVPTATRAMRRLRG